MALRLHATFGKIEGKLELPVSIELSCSRADGVPYRDEGRDDAGRTGGDRRAVILEELLEAGRIPMAEAGVQSEHRIVFRLLLVIWIIGCHGVLRRVKTRESSEHAIESQRAVQRH